MNKIDATNLATQFHLDLTKDFYMLTGQEIEKVLAAADYVHYRKPANANGSRGRYFFCKLQRATRTDS